MNPLLASGALARRVPVPADITAGTPGVICVDVHPAVILTVAAQLASGTVGTLLVSCCRHLPPPGGVSVFTDPKHWDRPADRIVAVSAHCLRNVEQCNMLTRRMGDNSRLILLVPTGSHLHSSLHQMVDKFLSIMLPPEGWQPLKKHEIVYDKTPIPETPVQLLLVLRSADLDTQPIPQLYDDRVARHSFRTETTEETEFWTGQLVRCTFASALHEAGVMTGVIGVIERFTRGGLPVVRFATDAVMIIALVPGKKTKKDETPPPHMPLTPCNSCVTLKDLQELMVLPSGWTLTLTQGVNTGPIRHLL